MIGGLRVGLKRGFPSPSLDRRAVAVVLFALLSGVAVPLLPIPFAVPAALGVAATVAIGIALRLGRWLTVVAVIALPIFGAYSEIVPTNELSPLKDVLIGVALLVSIAEPRAVARAVASWNVADSAMLLLISTYVLYLPFAPSALQGLFGFKVTVWYASFYVLARLHAPNLSLRALELTLSIAFVLFAVWEIMSATILFDRLPLLSASGRPLWDPPTRVHFSDGMQPVALGFLFGAWSLLFRRIVSPVGWALVTLCGYLMLFAQNRTALVVAGSGLVYIILSRSSTRNARAFWSILLLTVFVLFVMSGAAVGVFEPGAPLQLITLRVRVDDLFENLIPALLSSPFGTGAGTVAGTQATFTFKELTSGDSARVFFDSGFLSLALEIGLLPPLLLGAFFLAVLVRCAEAAFAHRSSFTAFCGAVITGFLLSNLVNPAIYQFPFNALAWFMAGVAVSAASSSVSGHWPGGSTPGRSPRDAPDHKRRTGNTDSGS
ncbi:MAG: hypothetical protein AABM40_14660 [Chloroflexota bacterium]